MYKSIGYVAVINGNVRPGHAYKSGSKVYRTLGYAKGAMTQRYGIHPEYTYRRKPADSLEIEYREVFVECKENEILET